MFTVREAKKGDEGEILRLITELAVYEKMLDEVVNTEEMLRDMLFSDNPLIFAFIAEIDETNKAVGFALYFYNYSTFVGKKGLYLEDLFVEPEYRGKGIGKALFTRLAQESVKQDCGRFEWQVLDWNTPSIDFYKSMGAISMDGWSTFRLAGNALASLGAK
jgi:GNAT superfamily N-acetyltransferase